MRKHGIRLKLYDQPFEVLAMLIARSGELVTREEIQQKLWPSGTFVDFENGLNSAVNRLRDTLGDSAEEPKFIETVPRRGYRFLVPVEVLNGSSAQKTQSKATPRWERMKQWLWFAGGAAAAALVVTAFVGWRLSHSPRKTLNFGARDWVLISNFENRTGNPVLDGSLEYALERELSNSQFVNVVPRMRVEDALQLMRRPLNAKIDAALGREICLRDGGIRALLTGRVEKLGTTYVLSAQLVDPARGIAVASLSEDDPADSQMAGAVHRLSNRVREKLGEKLSLIQQSEANLEKVTTPSLKALQLYTQANRLMLDANSSGRSDLWLKANATAENLLKQVIQEDSRFASAYILLAWTLKNQEKPDKEFVPYAKRAFELSEQTSERERYFIQGSYYEMLHQEEQAVASYEALLRLFPDHYWGMNNLTDCYSILNRPQETWLAVRMADLRPHHPRSNMEAAMTNLFIEGDLNAARPYVERARKALAEQGPNADPYVSTFVRLFPIYDLWLKGDIRQAHDELVQLDSVKGLETGYVGYFYLPFGQIREAKQHFLARHGAFQGNTDMVFAYIAYVQGDRSALKRHLQEPKEDPADPRSAVAVLMIHAGMWGNVERGIRKYAPTKPPTITEGELALARNETARGISLLEQGLGSLVRGSNLDPAFFGFGDLAEAYVKQGKFGDAVRVLEGFSKWWRQNYFGPGHTGIYALMWMKNQMQLARLYLRMGREEEAKKIEDELRKMLIYADEDYPILRELKKRERLTAATAAN